MFCSTAFIRKSKSLSLIIALALSLSTSRTSQAQAYEKELSATGKASFTIKNRTGRVSVIASDNEKDASSLKATSTGGSVEPSDITVSGNEIVVRERPYRIDLTVRVPKRSRVKVESETGMVDVIATDHHGPRRRGVSPAEGLQKLIDRGASATAERAMGENPARIMREDLLPSGLPR